MPPTPLFSQILEYYGKPAGWQNKCSILGGNYNENPVYCRKLENVQDKEGSN